MLKYKPAEQIFDSIADDWRTYDDEDFINYSGLIKIIKWCNSELSLKINPESKAIVEITDFKGKLPNNFETLSLALLCTKTLVDTTKPSGFHLEHETESVCSNKCSVCLEECDVDFKVIRTCDKEYTEFTDLDLVTVVNTHTNKLSDFLPNYHSRSHNQIQIQGDYIHTNFREGTVYIEYVTTLEDDEGNLLVLDHPQVQPFYELACKKHIIHTTYYNSDDDVERKLDRISIDATRARTDAKRFVNMIEYDELVTVLKANRERFYHRYLKPFLDYKKNYTNRHLRL